MPPATGVTGLILAGGQGRRMGGVDKGLQLFRGRPLVEHVIERLQPQVDAMLISTSSSVYARYGFPVVSDEVGAGPLAGLHAALGACRTEFLVSVPCDAPLLPAALVSRLRTDLGHRDAAVARVGDKVHGVFALVRTSLREPLARFLRDGGRGVQAFYATVDATYVAFDHQAEAFTNLNTLESLRALERP